jgi:hypothetical protein
MLARIPSRNSGERECSKEASAIARMSSFAKTRNALTTRARTAKAHPHPRSIPRPRAIDSPMSSNGATSMR